MFVIISKSIILSIRIDKLYFCLMSIGKAIAELNSLKIILTIEDSLKNSVSRYHEYIT